MTCEIALSKLFRWTEISPRYSIVFIVLGEYLSSFSKSGFAKAYFSWLYSFSAFSKLVWERENKGIKIVYKDVKNNELVEKRERKERDRRELIHGGFDKNKVNVKKKNKKVKPGYKKKYHQDLQRAKVRAIRKTNKRWLDVTDRFTCINEW